LDDIAIQPNEKELALFQKSNDVLIQNAVKAAQSNVQFELFDRVHVYSGPLQGTVGHVVSIDDADIVQIETLLDNVLIEVPRQNIQRAFSCGNLVAVVCGNFKEGKALLQISMEQPLSCLALSWLKSLTIRSFLVKRWVNSLWCLILC
jgi:transcription elongation factor